MRFSFFSLLDRYENDTRSYPALYQQVLDQIVLADELGFDSYWIGEHHGQTSPGQVMACPHPAVLLVAAAKLTQRIGLNTAVANLTLRHPLQIAEDYALVDVLSQGRLGLGIWRGSFPHESPPLDRLPVRALVVLRRVGIFFSGSGVEKA